MMNEHFDVGIIGSGPAGLAAAFALQAAGKSVVIIEEYLWGGTCPNYGCDPKKMLLAAVEAKQQAEQLVPAGLTGKLDLDWSVLMRHKMAFTEPVAARKIVGLDEAGVVHRYGHASFIDKQTVKLPQQTITANNWVIATGTQPARLDVPGDQYLLDNEDFLNLTTMPAEIVLVGGGFIAIEFANLAAAVGTKVHIILKGTAILTEFDQALAQELKQAMQAKGITFHDNFMTQAVQKQGARVELLANDGRIVSADSGFVAIGRHGNTDALNLAAAEVELTDSLVKVDGYLKTTADNIYAAGDVTNLAVPKLTPTASAQGRYVAQHILGLNAEPIHFPATPVVVFGAPKLAQVGVNPEVAVEQGYQVTDFDMTRWMGYYRSLEPLAQARIVLNESGVIVGASVLASHADELINYLTIAINRRQNQKDLRSEMYAYPSLGSDMTTFLGAAMD